MQYNIDCFQYRQDKRDLKYDEDNLNADFEEIDDMITLNGFGIQTVWQYPKNITYCTNRSCGCTFDNRSDAINHYKEQHADQFILCSVCTKPVAARSFIKHYKNIHPHNEIPADDIEMSKISMKAGSHDQEVYQFQMLFIVLNYFDFDMNFR